MSKGGLGITVEERKGEDKREEGEERRRSEDTTEYLLNKHI